MKKAIFGAILPLFAVGLMVAPNTAVAGEVDCALPEGVTDLSEYGGGGDAPEDAWLGVYSGTRGETYSFECDVTDGGEPAMVVITGGDLVSWEYDEAFEEIHIEMDFTGYAEGIEFGPPEGQAAVAGPPETVDPFGVAVIWPESGEDDGLPEELIGAWMATNTNDWNLLEPTEENPFFGFDLNGPAGEDIFFHMFIPDETVALLEELAGENINFNNLALFIGNEQATMNLKKVAGGVMVEINITFSEFQTVARTAATATVAKRVKLGKQKPISLAAKKTKVKKGTRTKLYGWVKKGPRRVVLARKNKGSRHFVRVKVKRSKDNGHFTFWIRPKKTNIYRVITKIQGKHYKGFERVKVY